MKDIKKRIRSNLIFLIATTVNLLLVFPIGNMAVLAASQTGQLNVSPGAIIISKIPGTFTFPTTFIPPAGNSTQVYGSLDPNNPDNTVEISDSDPNNGFTLSISATDFVNASNNLKVISSLQNFNFVTLSSGAGSVDLGANNTSANSNLLNANFYCPWKSLIINNEPFSATCGPQMYSFSNPICTAGDCIILSSTEAGDVGIYGMNLGFRLNLDNTNLADVITTGDYNSVITFTLTLCGFSCP